VRRRLPLGAQQAHDVLNKRAIVLSEESVSLQTADESVGSSVTARRLR
jgi:hypothetical protein